MFDPANRSYQLWRTTGAGYEHIPNLHHDGWVNFESSGQLLVFCLPECSVIDAPRFQNSPGIPFRKETCRLGAYPLLYRANNCPQSSCLPMLRDVSEPGDAGGFEGYVGIEATGDGPPAPGFSGIAGGEAAG